MPDCSNCGGGVVYARGRCRHCYRWWMRYGTERPLALQRRLVERAIDRDYQSRGYPPDRSPVG